MYVCMLYRSFVLFFSIKLPGISKLPQPVKLEYVAISRRQDYFIELCLKALKLDITCDLKNMVNGFSRTPVSCTELNIIQSKFKQRSLQMVSVEKITNPFLLLSYVLKKHEYLKNYNVVNESQLFHGTRSTHISSICQNNFNWRLRGEFSSNPSWHIYSALKIRAFQKIYNY